MAREYIMVTNWSEYQHYKKRDPPWIKLYVRLLDNYEFCCLPDAAKWHVCAIFLLASRYSNKIPADSKWIANRISGTEDIDLPLLVSSGLITMYQDDSNVLAECLSRDRGRDRSTETEKETDELSTELSTDEHGKTIGDYLKEGMPKR